MEEIPTDVLYELMKRMDDEDLIQYCQSNPNVQKLCQRNEIKNRINQIKNNMRDQYNTDIRILNQLGDRVEIKIFKGMSRLFSQTVNKNQVIPTLKRELQNLGYPYDVSKIKPSYNTVVYSI